MFALAWLLGGWGSIAAWSAANVPTRTVVSWGQASAASGRNQPVCDLLGPGRHWYIGLERCTRLAQGGGRDSELAASARVRMRLKCTPLWLLISGLCERSASLCCA